MLESLYVAMESGFSVPDYRYVGMGGITFYDFRLIHKYLGITNMTSLEHDDAMVERARFNCPYRLISVEHMTVQDFVLSDTFGGNSVYWLDYDETISEKVTSDIGAILGNIQLRDFIFVTVAGSTPRFLSKRNSEGRLAELKDRLPQFTTSLSRADMEDGSFPNAIRGILRAAFNQACSPRRDGEFSPFFQIRYADGMEMVTYGGVFATRNDCARFDARLREKIPFIGRDMQESYRIKRFNVTERERGLFELAATAERSNAKEIGRLYALGFDQDELARYRELLRYQPRYVETLL